MTMNLRTCHKCGNLAVSFDTRAQAWLCHMTGRSGWSARDPDEKPADQLKQALAEYTEARDRLKALAESVFPIGSWVRIDPPGIVGKIHDHDEMTAGLILEHGQVRWFALETLTPCEVPWWAKCATCGLEMESAGGWGRMRCVPCENQAALSSMPKPQGATS